VPPGTLTARFNGDQQRVLAASRDDDAIDISDWLGGQFARGKEDVIGLGRYGRTLTVLTCAIRDESDEKDDEDEEKLIEGWTPRFHKR